MTASHVSEGGSGSGGNSVGVEKWLDSGSDLGINLLY